MGDYTDNLGFYMPDTGEVGWGDEVNNNVLILDDVLSTADAAVQYVSPIGDDANDGMTPNRPKETILAAYDALSAGGKIYIADETYVGGEVANQGIWIIGSNDFQFDSPPAGWRIEKRVDFIGTGGANVQFMQTGSRIYGGQPGQGFDVDDPLKPAFWLAGVFAGIKIERIFVDDCAIVLRAGISADMANRSAATSRLLVRECSFSNGISDPTERTDKAPVMEFGYVFWAYFDLCAFLNQRAGREAAEDFTSDTSAAVLIKPALAATTLAEDTTDSVTTFDVVDGSEFPDDNFLIFINGFVGDVVHNEVALVGTRTGNTFSDVTRGYAFGPGVTHATGNDVIQFPQNSAGLVHFNRIISAGGGLKYYRGNTSWSIYVDDWLQEGDFVHPIGCTVWIVNADGFGSASLTDVQAADAFANTEPLIRIGGSPPPGVIRIGQIFPQWVEGPYFRDVPFATGAPPTNELAEQGGFGFVGRRFVGKHDGAVRGGAPSAVPFLNLAEQDVSAWSGLAGSPAATVTTGQRDVYGGTNAATLSVASSYGVRHPYRASVSLSVDDWIIGGVWCKPEETTGMALFPAELLIGIGNATFVGGLNYNIGGVDVTTVEVPVGRWQWLVTSGKVATDTGANEMYMSLACEVDADRTFCFPFFCRIPAGTLEDNEVAEMLDHMGTWAQGAEAGSVSTLFGQKFIAHGGLGVGNSASATTPGSVVKKMQIFDETGASLGYVPIYSAIT